MIKGNHEYYFAEYLYLAGKKIRRNDWNPGLAAGGSLDCSPGRLEEIENFWFHWFPGSEKYEQGGCWYGHLWQTCCFSGWSQT